MGLVLAVVGVVGISVPGLQFLLRKRQWAVKVGSKGTVGKVQRKSAGCC